MTSTLKPFGPTAIATPANVLTFTRLGLAPVYGVLVAEFGPTGWMLWLGWTILAFSDSLDGHLARRLGATRSGAFLDPLADKLLVLAALSGLASIHTISWLPVGLIAVREVAMNTFRMYASRRGISIPAKTTAKLKTLAQVLAIGAAVFPPIGVTHLGVVRDILWVAVALTLLTGLEYFVDGRRLLRATPRKPEGAH